jgi:hypothetical protein
MAAVPAHIAIGFHLVDYVMHGWDVAASINASAKASADASDVDYAPEIIAVASTIAK